MFQSSRIASGNCLRHASSACSPSSASTIWNDIPSRMRRATLRMTLESSTTKQVFIFVPHSLSRGSGRYRGSRIDARYSRCDGAIADRKHPIDIEQNEQLTLEPE